MSSVERAAAISGASPRRRGRPPSPDRRATLLDLAAAMFAKDGYHGTSIRDLADRAGMNAASLYHYFKSKEDALFEVCLAGAKGSADRIEDVIKSRTQLAERLREITRRQVEDLAVHSDYRHVYFEQRSHLSADQRAVIDKQTRRVRRLLDRVFEDAEKVGELRPDVTPRQATLIFAATLRSLTQYYVDGPVPNHSELSIAMLEVTLRGLMTSDPKKGML